MNASVWFLLGCLVNGATVTQLHRLFSYHNQIYKQERRDERVFGIPPRLDYGARGKKRALAFCWLEEGSDAGDATRCGTD